MKRLVLIAAFALAALPAFAASTTVEFIAADGTVTTVVFKDDGTAIMNGGAPVAYTVDETAKTICSTVNGSEICATFAEMGKGVGFTTTYTTTAGSSGTAKIVAEDQ